jgi:hypothetical protein
MTPRSSLSLTILATCLAAEGLVGACAYDKVDLGLNAAADGGATPARGDEVGNPIPEPDTSTPPRDAGTADACAEPTLADVTLCNPAPAQPDAGVGTPALNSPLCVENGSFEGIPGFVSALPHWQTCGNNSLAIVDPTVCSMPPADGLSYLGLPVGVSARSTTLSASVSTRLSTPLSPGARYPFTIDVGIAVRTVRPLFSSGGSPALLEIYGAASPCGRDELLWTTTIMNQDSWEPKPGSLVPSQALAYLVLVVTLANSSQPPQASYVILDNLEAGVACTQQHD